MTTFRIDATNLDASPKTGTISPDRAWWYTDKLLDGGETNEAEIRLSSMTPTMRELIEVGGEITIYRDGSVDFTGQVMTIDDLDAGGKRIYIEGKEIELVDEHGSYSSSPYTSTASATIAGDIIGESTNFSAGTIDAGSNIDFRINSSSSLMDALVKLANLTGQDIGIDYVNTEAEVLDHKGSSTSVATLNDKSDIVNFRRSVGRPQANYVVIRGKGDGDNQITSTSANGQDATSQGKYGVIKRYITNRQVMSESQANTLANAEVARLKDPVKIYQFDVANPNRSFVSGDVITLNAPDKDVDSEEVRITEVRRGQRPRGGKMQTFMKLEVANAAYSRKTKKARDIRREIAQQSRENANYMQGSTNEMAWPGARNANNSVPLTINFKVPSSIQDEAGNMRVNSLTLDYDVDKFNEQFGGVTESDQSPSLSGNAASHGHSPTDTGHAHDTPVFTSSSYTLVSDEGYDTSINDSLSSGWNTDVCSEAISGTFDFVFARVRLSPDFSSADFDVGIRLKLGSTQKLIKFWTGLSTSWATTIIDEIFVLPIFASTSSNVNLDVWCDTARQYDVYLDVWGSGQAHNHTIPADNVDSDNASIDQTNQNPSLSGNAASHNHGVSIGDGVGEARETNASQVSVYLDFYNTGTSSWDNKHSVLNTGQTLEEDLDISNSGTYPDAPGLWRVRVLTDNSSADFLQAIVRIKAAVDA